MSFFKWILCGLVSISMTVLGKFLSPVLPFFVDKQTKRLPEWLSWFMTPNTDADGDPAHCERHPGTGWWPTYKRRTAWFWRNTLYGFDRTVLGIHCSSTDYLTIKGNTLAGRRPFVPGYCFRRLYRDGRLIGWQLYVCYGWPFGLFKKRCIRGNFGWKLWGNTVRDGDYAMWTGMCNPFFSRE